MRMTPRCKSRSAQCSAHNSPRRAPVTAASHRYSASRSWPDARAAAMTFATSAGFGEVAVRCPSLPGCREALAPLLLLTRGRGRRDHDMTATLDRGLAAADAGVVADGRP